MTCDEYGEWVSADVDGILGDAGGGVRSHVTECPNCRALREAQVSVRALLRSRAPLVRAPLGLRTRIIAEIEGEAAPRARVWEAIRWIGVALATAGILLSLNPRPDPGLFEPVVRSSQAAIERATVAYETTSPADLARYYETVLGAAGSPRVHDFAAKEFRLEGGMLREIRGHPARISLYRDGENVLVCHLLPSAAFPGLRLGVFGYALYSIRGMSVLVSRAGDEICFLASRMPIEEFRERF